jgi:hypothetical protein
MVSAGVKTNRSMLDFALHILMLRVRHTLPTSLSHEGDCAMADRKTVVFLDRKCG